MSYYQLAQGLAGIGLLLVFPVGMILLNVFVGGGK